MNTTQQRKKYNIPLKENTTNITVKIPNSIFEEIDHLCNVNNISKNSWLIKAIQNYLNRERLIKLQEFKIKRRLELNMNIIAC